MKTSIKFLTKKIYVFLFISFTIFNLNSLSIGSDNNPSRQSNAVFSGPSNNEMNGFAIFEGGFTLQDLNTVCTFDSSFPVSGTVEMNHGVLGLQKNLIFDEGTVLDSVGNIYGNNFFLEFANSTTVMSSGDAGSIFFYDIAIYFKADMSWQMPVSFRGSSTIDAADRYITLESAGSIDVASTSTLTISNAKLKNLSGSNLSCDNNTGSIILKNCTLFLSDDFEFSTGSLGFLNDVKLSGTKQFTYSSVLTSTIESYSKLTIGPGAIFYYAPTIDDRDLLLMRDKTSCLHLDGCTLRSSTTGLRLTKGTLLLDNNVTFSSDGTITGESICFGNGVSSDDVDVVILSGAEISVDKGLDYDGV